MKAKLTPAQNFIQSGAWEDGGARVAQGVMRPAPKKLG